MDIETIGIIVLLALLVLVVVFFIPRWLTRRAAHQIISILRKHNAVDSKTARTVDELGLRAPGMLQRLGRRRDYKPQAMNILLQAEIIQLTEDGRLYLSEDKLASFGLEKGTSVYR